MSKTHSPTHFNGETDIFYDPNFPADINTQMRVPKSIRVNGDYPDENITITNRAMWNQIPAMEKLEMHVPDRILVVGQEQHVGTKAPPPEIVLENAVMRTEPAIVRVQTPPRILTLDNHYFPAVDEDDPPINHNEVAKPVDVPKAYNAETQITRHVREQTPFNALDVSLPPTEEVQHLRRQVGKLNRRVMALELDMLHRQQRDKLLYIATVAYFILKAFSWLTRN
ncbi:PREDICTED: transport and Golgi organization protein 11 [Cyphomyrmex costatus]|uniref:Transport and Golgi organization protein 11 n=1 Tax=Cyphomyrmex costatus TaxID=456900 RepID=A0A151IF16_9HYME|nr:PREDICTED: transport and Golgi organization protein 11 [Cyphomyrmex costatus]XP_018399069.1 PREDICTED: transport and Golgi organization protein 11 [Cyphomyrmex costatus]XP_018399070.1 PREDICTED: transport and Golgi organization protein 11 [Cyphomyrmex costatus]XP_018399071.1 PREDICTED: transport and Golgi organization protein 11 [Cyphomyrmex costatus]XP_018399073.1 PREDICTED: transport and Golgi organization protein 11 [Cyphomyrmex costatus]KYM99288.1 Transport and Golgi organization protei